MEIPEPSPFLHQHSRRRNRLGTASPSVQKRRSGLTSATVSPSEMSLAAPSMGSTPAPLQIGIKRKRQQTNVACENCRKKKSKCDGVRPKCHQCEKRDLQCDYATEHQDESRSGALKRENEWLRRQVDHLEGLNSRNADLENFLQLLRNATDDKGQELLQLLKQNGVDEVLSSLAPILQSVSSSVSPHPTARTLSPPTSSRLEYELVASHSSAYPTLTSAVDGVPLYRTMSGSDMTARNSGMFSGESGRILSLDQADNCLPYLPSSPVLDPLLRTNTTSLQPNHPVSSNLVPLGPAPAPRHCDPRLNKVKINHWTDVAISDQFASRLISFYLETDHACLPFFDADLFLRDLERQDGPFCTPLLVNAVLLHASVAYTANDLRAATLTPAFRYAVERLWVKERHVDSITTVAAASMLQVTCSQICENVLAVDFGAVSREMAVRLQLVRLGRRTKQPAVRYSDDELRAASHTAWGIFNLSSLWTFYLHDVAPYLPPIFPIPGDQDQQANGRPVPPLPEYMGQTFTSLCKFWLIAYEFIETYYFDLNVPIIARVPLAFAESAYQKLLVWANEHFSSNENQPRIHHEAIMRVYFHLVIIELMRPFADIEGTFLRSFSYPESTPKAALQASVNQLKRYVRDYRLLFGSFFTTMILQPALLYVANALITDRTDPDWDHYLNLCFVEHIRLSLQYPLASVLLEGLLAMAAEKNLLSLEGAKTLLNEASAAGAARLLANGTVVPHQEGAKTLLGSSVNSNGAGSGSKFVADHSLALTDHVGSRIDVLSEHFRDRLMFHELTVDESSWSSECVR